jgi:uncharacterized damage-inducible protein DinB
MNIFKDPDMANQINDLVKQFTDLQHGDCWIGVNFKTTLHDIDHKIASGSMNGSNSIWQLVNHIIYWRTIVINRLTGSVNPPPFSDFLLPDELSEENWKQTLHDFESSYHSLRSSLLHFNEDFLHFPSPKEGQTFYDVIVGCLQHDAYHLGQIKLLSKLI